MSSILCFLFLVGHSQLPQLGYLSSLFQNILFPFLNAQSALSTPFHKFQEHRKSFPASGPLYLLYPLPRVEVALFIAQSGPSGLIMESLLLEPSDHSKEGARSPAQHSQTKGHKPTKLECNSCCVGGRIAMALASGLDDSIRPESGCPIQWEQPLCSPSWGAAL